MLFLTHNFVFTSHGEHGNYWRCDPSSHSVLCRSILYAACGGQICCFAGNESVSLFPRMHFSHRLKKERACCPVSPLFQASNGVVWIDSLSLSLLLPVSLLLSEQGSNTIHHPFPYTTIFYLFYLSLCPSIFTHPDSLSLFSFLFERVFCVI